MELSPNQLGRRQYNYLDWSVQLKTYLVAQDLWEIVESRSDPPAPENEAAFKAWSKTNAMALYAIQTTCEPDTFCHIREISSARLAWDTLAEKYKTNTRESDKEGNIDDGVKTYVDLYKNLQIGNWNAAKEFLDSHPLAISAKITVTEKTALHVAAEAGHVHIVEELVKQMSEENLEVKDNEGFTALALATYNGNYRIAECMLGKNENLISIPDNKGCIPVVLALYNGHLKLARYLYLLTLGLGPIDRDHSLPEILKPENGTMGASVVCEAIYNKALDIALDLVNRYPPLLVTEDRYGDSPFYALACMPDYFLCGNGLVFWKRWIYSACFL